MAIPGLLGKKLGMVQVIGEGGAVVGCTVLEVGPCPVTQIMTELRDGYSGVQVGYGEAPAWRINQAELGHTAANGPLKYLAVFRADEQELSDLEVGTVVNATEVFSAGDRVDVQGISKGKGFAGVVKRHGFRGGPRTHGQSDRHRAPGSVGAGTTPGRVLKGTRMAGRMGGQTTTSMNLEVVDINADRHLVFVKGSVPGATNGLVRIRQTKRRGGKR
jgi:large subunit ribosomal protein L3